MEKMKDNTCEEVVFSISRVEDCWEKMLVEECLATYPGNKYAEPTSRLIKDHWLDKVFRSEEIQMRDTVRDYEVNVKAIKSQLKDCLEDPQNPEAKKYFI